MYIFNPEHDLCLANGSPDFVPPAAALELARKGAGMVRYMRAPGSVPGEDGTGGRIVPWGWNRVLRKKLLLEGVPAAALPPDEELDFIREKSHRRFALQLHRELEESLCGSCSPGCVQRHGLVPSASRLLAAAPEEVERFLPLCTGAVLKAPWSGSGRGIRFVSGGLSGNDRGWCSRVMARQGSLMVERRWKVDLEFAMLFEFAGPEDGGKGPVSFAGYSLFEAANGAYVQNVLASNQEIERRIAAYVPLPLLHAVRERTLAFFSRELAGRYRGFAGVDQFAAQGLFHPAVEINLRMTMGLLARNAYDYSLCGGSRFRL